MIIEENGLLTYVGDTFKIRLTRYSDPERLNSARNAARYLGKSDLENIRRPLNIIKQGHVPAVFRGEMAEFEFEDVSKEAYDHLITYSTANMRVAGGNRALKSDSFTMPSDKMKNPERVKTAIQGSMKNYHGLLESGETPQVSRGAMPVNAKLNTFVFQFNFVTLAESVFKQRIWEKGAQGNTVKVVKGMCELVHFMDNELWETFYDWYGEPATSWVEVRRKIQKEKITVNQLIENLQLAVEGKLTDRRGNPLPQINANGSSFEELNKLYGELKSMW